MRTMVRFDIGNRKKRRSTDLWHLHLDVLAFGGGMFDVNVVVCWVVLLLVPERVLTREDPPENQGDDTADEETPGNYTPWDVVSWHVFGLPHERSDGVPNTVGDQNYGVRCDPFGMTRGGGGDPGKDEDKPG